MNIQLGTLVQESEVTGLEASLAPDTGPFCSLLCPQHLKWCPTHSCGHSVNNGWVDDQGVILLVDFLVADPETKNWVQIVDLEGDPR